MGIGQHFLRDLESNLLAPGYSRRLRPRLFLHQSPGLLQQDSFSSRDRDGHDDHLSF